MFGGNEGVATVKVHAGCVAYTVSIHSFALVSLLALSRCFQVSATIQLCSRAWRFLFDRALRNRLRRPIIDGKMVRSIHCPSAERDNLSLVIVLQSTTWSFMLIVRRNGRLGYSGVVYIVTVGVERYTRESSLCEVLARCWRSRRPRLAGRHTSRWHPRRALCSRVWGVTVHGGIRRVTVHSRIGGIAIWGGVRAVTIHARIGGITRRADARTCSTRLVNGSIVNSRRHLSRLLWRIMWVVVIRLI